MQYRLCKQIAQMKQDVASGKAHPMAQKKELARTIVADFHSADAAAKAGEDWAKQFQKREVPERVEEVTIPLANVVAAKSDAEVEHLFDNPGIHWIPDRNTVLHAPPEQPRKLLKLEKVLARAGLADSATDGLRKIKQKAVEIDGQTVTAVHLLVLFPISGLVIRAGRRMKIVSISE